MAACPSCGAERGPADAPCRTCGSPAPARAQARAAPELELDVPAKRAPKTSPRRKAADEEVSLELAVDPRSLFEPGLSPASAREPAVAPPVAMARVAAPAVGDLAFDARLLADFGDPPRQILLAPLYAWRVLRRQRDLKKMLVARREEAARAADEAEDALVALAERVRSAAEKHAAYGVVLQALRHAEDDLRSRDQVLAADQDAQNARLASVDARLAKLESEVGESQTAERLTASELLSAQNALGRAEAKLKRVESELRGAQQREGGGTGE